MTGRCSGSGLILAGLIVSVIGVSLVLIHTLAIPRYWTTLGIGLALLAVGAVRAVVARRHRPGAGAS